VFRQYNFLNLPTEITFANGTRIINRYSADGTKIETFNVMQVSQMLSPITTSYITVHGDTVTHTENVYKTESTGYGTYYAGNVEYLFDRKSTITENLFSISGIPTEENQITGKRIHNPEGYVSNNQYFYYRRDHLGNNREVWNATTDQTAQRMQYYPSGLPMQDRSHDNPNVQPYKFGDKEFIEEHGLDEYDFNARNFYPAIMRFTTMDPLAEKYYSVSPYAYCANNPVRHIDPSGKFYFNSDDYTDEQLSEWGISRSDLEFFSNIVSNVSNLVDDKVMAAILNTTGLSEEQVRSDLTAGQGPVVSITTTPGKTSVYGNLQDGIVVSPDVVKYLGTMYQNNDSKGIALQTVGIGLSMLHEYGHIGDQITNDGNNSGQYYPGGENYAEGGGNNIERGRQPWNNGMSGTGHRGDDIEMYGFGFEKPVSISIGGSSIGKVFIPTISDKTRKSIIDVNSLFNKLTKK
jgi:RHS repeat-associated protein